MQIFKYAVFLLFRLAYKDGNYREADVPYFHTTSVIALYEAIALIIIMHFLQFSMGLTLISDFFSSIRKIVYGGGILIIVVVYPLNHYFFIKRNGLDHIYSEFKNASINTKRNRVIGYSCLILYWPIMCVIGGHLKYWFPLMQ